MILMYHNIGPETTYDTLSEDKFVGHLNYIQASGRTVLSLEAYVDRLEQGIPLEQAVTFTFDDAFVSIREIILPLMQTYEFPFSVFVPVDHVGDHNAWDAPSAAEGINIMDWDQLRDLLAEPLVTLGSHTLSHRSLGSLTAAETELEISASKKKLESELGIKIHYFAFPFGQKKDLGHASKALFQKHGYRAALSTNWSRTNSVEQLYCLNRLEVNASDDTESLKAKMTRLPDTRALKQKIKNGLSRVKRL